MPSLVAPRSIAEVSLLRFREGHARNADDRVAVEEPLEIQLGFGPRDARQVKSISVTMRTPGDDLNLAAGFIMTEGVVRDAADIASIQFAAHEAGKAVAGAMLRPNATGNAVRVELAPDVTVSMAALQRNFYTTSSCGICGKASLLALQTVCPPRARNAIHLRADVIEGLPAKLQAGQTLFAQTGGLHGAALFSADGTLHAVCEDVGRHNAVDKLLGAEFLADRTPLRDRLLMLSGRCSFELMQKALMAGIPAVVAVGAPSSLAVQVARQFDMVLAGFVRGVVFNVYSGAEHISGIEEAGSREPA